MWCDEQDSKQLLTWVGIATPRGDIASTADAAYRIAAELGGVVYVKALTTSTSRAARGGVVRADGPAQASAAFTAVTAALGATEARVEAASTVDSEFYLGAGFMPGSNEPEIVLSKHGGSGIEDRAETVHRVSIDPLVGLRPFHVRRLLAAAGLGPEFRAVVWPAISGCYDLVAAHDVTLVELNPLGISAAGAVALDARITLDSYAAYRNPRWKTLRAFTREVESVQGMLSDAGIAYIPLEGDIGVIGLGAGLTMHLTDWITNIGGRPAFFFDATTAAVRDHASLFANEPAQRFTEALRFGLDKVAHDVDVLLANFTSGGTPVNGLAAALLTALDDIGWKGQLVLHVAGNRQVEAVTFLRGAGIEPAASLGAAVRIAVEFARAA